MHIAKLAVRGEKGERPAARPSSDRGDELLGGQVKPLVLRQGNVGGQADEGLVVEIERRRKDQLLDLGAQTDPRAEVVEGPADRKRCGSEHGRAPLRVDTLAEERANIDGRGPQQEVLGARNLAEPVNAIRVGPYQGLVEEPHRGIEAAADHLELSDALVRLFAAQPLAHTANGAAQRRIERGERGDGVLGRHADVHPLRIAAHGGCDANGLLPSLGLAQARSDPDVRDAEQLAAVSRCGEGVGLGFREGLARGAQVRLALQLFQQPVHPPGIVPPREALEQRDQTRAVDFLTQTPRCGLFQVVRLVDHEVVELRQEAPANLDIGQEQRVIDHDEVCGLGLRARAVDVAVLLRTVDADAVEWVAGDPVPQHLLAPVQAKLRAIAALGGVQPDEDLELEHQLLGVLAWLAEVAPPAAQRHIVRPAFEQACLEVPGQPFAQPGQVFGHQLLLERVRVGRDDDTLAVTYSPRDRRHEVGEALAGPRPGLHHQRAPARLDLGDREQHLKLRLPMLVTRQ